MANERGWLTPKRFFFCTLNGLKLSLLRQLYIWSTISILYACYIFGSMCTIWGKKSTSTEKYWNCYSEGRILPCDADTLFPRNSIQRRNLDPFPMTTQQPPNVIIVLDSRLVPPPLFHTSQRRLALEDFLLELPAALLHMWRAACPQVTCPLSCVWHARALGVPRSHYTRWSLFFFFPDDTMSSALESRDWVLSSPIALFYLFFFRLSVLSFLSFKFLLFFKETVWHAVTMNNLNTSLECSVKSTILARL